MRAASQLQAYPFLEVMRRWHTLPARRSSATQVRRLVVGR